jgi:hypothetical protein
MIAGGNSWRPSETVVARHLADQTETRRRCLVPLRGDQGFQDLAFSIDGAPEIADLQFDTHIWLDMR